MFAEVTTGDAQVVQTDSVKLSFSLNNRNGNTIRLKKIMLNDFTLALDTALLSNQNFTFSKPVYVSPGEPLSQPYWLKNEMKEGHFEINDQQLIGNAENAAAYNATFVLNIEGRDFEIIKPVKQKYTDPVKGELYEPVIIVPPVVVSPNKNLLLSATETAQTMRITVHAMKDIIKPALKIIPGKGWQAEIANSGTADTLRKGQEMDADVLLKPIPKEREKLGDCLIYRFIS